MLKTTQIKEEGPTLQDVARTLQIKQLNPSLLCTLCNGYLIDATTIIECLHSFCRSCIVKYLETHKYCPICEVQVHKTKPLLNIRSDEVLQDIVYKLVPGLFQNEMRRRREFHTRNVTSNTQNNAVPMETHIDDNPVCLSLEYDDQSKSKKFMSISSHHRRFLRCPKAVRIHHLQKLLRSKYALDEKHHRVDVMCAGEKLNTEMTVGEMATMYLWRTKSPLHLTYKIFTAISNTQNSIPKVDNSKKCENVILKNSDNNWKEVQLQISENGVMSVTGIENSQRQTGTSPNEADFLNNNKIEPQNENKSKAESSKQESQENLKNFEELGPTKAKRPKTECTKDPENSKKIIKNQQNLNLDSKFKKQEDSKMDLEKSSSPSPKNEISKSQNSSLKSDISNIGSNKNLGSKNFDKNEKLSSQISGGQSLNLQNVSSQNLNVQNSSSQNSSSQNTSSQKISAQNTSGLNISYQNPNSPNLNSSSPNLNNKNTSGQNKNLSSQNSGDQLSKSGQKLPKITAEFSKNQNLDQRNPSDNFSQNSPNIGQTSEFSKSNENFSKSCLILDSNDKVSKSSSPNLSQNSSGQNLSQNNNSNLSSQNFFQNLNLSGPNNTKNSQNLSSGPNKSNNQNFDSPKNKQNEKIASSLKIEQLKNTTENPKLSSMENSSNGNKNISKTTPMENSTSGNSRNITKSTPVENPSSGNPQNITKSSSMENPSSGNITKSTPVENPNANQKNDSHKVPKSGPIEKLSSGHPLKIHSQKNQINPKPTPVSQKSSNASQKAPIEDLKTQKNLPTPGIQLSRVGIVPKKITPNYKTLRDPPKAWNPQLPPAPPKNTEINSKNEQKPAKFFKARNMPRFLGNPASGVKPLFNVPPENEKGGPTSEGRPNTPRPFTKIDPKTLKPMTQNSSQLKINQSTVPIFNKQKMGPSINNGVNRRKDSPPSPLLNSRPQLSFTPPNPFIPNLQSPNLAPGHPHHFLYPNTPPMPPHPLYYSPPMQRPQTSTGVSDKKINRAT